MCRQIHPGCCWAGRGWLRGGEETSAERSKEPSEQGEGKCCEDGNILGCCYIFWKNPNRLFGQPNI